MEHQQFHLSLIGAGVVLAGILYIVLKSLWTSPLSKIPGAHWSSGISPLWILWQRWNGNELHEAVKAHRKFGPVVRLGPKDLSVSCYQDGIRKIYGGGFDKPGYYDFFSYYGKTNSFSSRTRHEHAFHRRSMSTPYTKSSLFGSRPLLTMTRRTLYERLIPRLRMESQASKPTEMLELSYALCLDLVTQFIFGFSNASNFLEAPETATRNWLGHYERRFCKESFWSQELPRMTQYLTRFGLNPMTVGHEESTQWMEAWMMEMCDGASKTLQRRNNEVVENPEDTPLVFETVYTTLKRFQTQSSLGGEDAKDLTLSVASELFDHMSGAREVLGLVLAYTIYYIARHPTAQQTLREEVRGAGLAMCIGKDSVDELMPSPQALDKLPYLSAVLKESFRMRPNSTPLPRLTPADRDVCLGRYENIPPGTRVNSFQWFVHRDPSKWDAVDEWRPERWLEKDDEDDELLSSSSTEKMDDPKQQQQQQQRAGEARLWAFGSGPRICVGLHLTQYLMRYILACIFTNFKVSVEDAAPFGEHEPGSLEDKIWLKFEELAV